MYYFKFALKWWAGEEKCQECGIVAAEGFTDAIHHLDNQYGDIYDIHLDYCGEDEGEVLSSEAIDDYLKWREIYKGGE